MTTTKTIQLRRTGLTPIDVEPVFVDGSIQLFDFWIDGEWQGSRRLLRYIEEELKPKPKIKVDSGERTWPKFVFIILTQEILPRVKKNKLKLTDFPAGFCHIIADLEFKKVIDRKKHRKFLDDHVEWVKAGRPRNEEEDKELIKYITEKVNGKD